MSRFNIYQINHHDPKVVGQKKRRLVLLYSIFTLVFILLFQIGINILLIRFSLLLLVSLPSIAAFYIFMHLKLKSDLTQIKTIGDIEFTRTGIRKKIGDSFAEYDFNKIEKLELQKHIPTIAIRDSKSGYFSYILKIYFINSSSESLVVSDRPVNKKQDLSIVETMKTLKKFIHPHIIIKL